MIFFLIFKLSKLEKGEFVEIGSLQQKRYGHGAIFDGDYMMVFGGTESASEPNRDTEKCTLVDTKVVCTTQEPALKRFITYPELFLVEPDFCDKKLTDLTIDLV